LAIIASLGPNLPINQVFQRLPSYFRAFLLKINKIE
jgi:hypothetical protein